MSGFLLDTSILSELLKANHCDAGMRRWFDDTGANALFVSVLVLGEIRQESNEFGPATQPRQRHWKSGFAGLPLSSPIGCYR
jgi:predicted nucleic acid-binding protein